MLIGLFIASAKLFTMPGRPPDTPDTDDATISASHTTGTSQMALIASKALSRRSETFRTG